MNEWKKDSLGGKKTLYSRSVKENAEFFNAKGEVDKSVVSDFDSQFEKDNTYNAASHAYDRREFVAKLFKGLFALLIILVLVGGALYFFKFKQYTVEFELYEDAEPIVEQVGFGQLIKAPSDVKREGYYFIGWYKDNGEKWDFSKDKVFKDVSIKAEWKNISETKYSEFISNASESVKNATSVKTYTGTTTLTINVPNELKGLVETGTLKVNVTVKCDASLQYRSNKKTATANIYLKYDDGDFEKMTTLSAIGGGWKTLHIDPTYGENVTNDTASLSKSYNVTDNEILIIIEYKYEVDFEEYKNWAGGTHAVNFSCDLSEVSYYFYVE